MNGIAELFPAGPPLDEEQQVGRRPFIDGLDDRMGRGEKTKLLATRRTGKSSAARAVVRRFKERGEPAASVDLSRLQNSDAVSRSLREQLTPIKALAAPARRAGGRLSTLLSKSEGENLESEALKLLAAWLEQGPSSPAGVLEQCAADHTQGAIVLDEAHLLAGWDPAEQTALRAFLRDDRTYGVVIASSEQSALETLVQAGGPLEDVGTRLTLPQIDPGDWTSELKRRFEELGAPIDPDALHLLLEESMAHPYCTMFLALESAVVGEFAGRVTTASVQAALSVVQADESWELRHDRLG